MFRNRDPSAVDGMFVEELDDLTHSKPATSWFNDVQENIVQAILDQGIELIENPTESDRNGYYQLSDAIQKAVNTKKYVTISDTINRTIEINHQTSKGKLLHAGEVLKFDINVDENLFKDRSVVVFDLITTGFKENAKPLYQLDAEPSNENIRSTHEKVAFKKEKEVEISDWPKEHIDDFFTQMLSFTEGFRVEAKAFEESSVRYSRTTSHAIRLELIRDDGKVVAIKNYFMNQSVKYLKPVISDSSLQFIDANPKQGSSSYSLHLYHSLLENESVLDGAYDTDPSTEVANVEVNVIFFGMKTISTIFY